MLKLIYGFGKHQSSRITMVDINYWDGEGWSTFATATRGPKGIWWCPGNIEKNKDKYPFIK